MNLREKQIHDNFLAAIDEIIRQKPNVLIHAGDLFDTVRPRPGPVRPCPERPERPDGSMRPASRS
jgi:hypothetical protein